MTKQIISIFRTIGTSFILLGFFCPPALAKSKTQIEQKTQSHEIRALKGISGEATLTVKQKLLLQKNQESLKFQNGKIVEDVQYYQSPRCYLHFRKNTQAVNQLNEGQVLRVNKIDNVYDKGSVHVTFWFDEDPQVSNLLCITNYNHTLNTAELKATLSNYFNVIFSKSVEAEALYNTVPSRQAPVLIENAPNQSNPNAARIMLSDS